MLNKFVLSLALLVFVLCPLFRELRSNENQKTNGLDSLSTELKKLSTVPSLSQTAQWLSAETLAVGRWDGVITVFQGKESLSISQALVTPSRLGITMLEKINNKLFISSNGSSIAVWECVGNTYRLKTTYPFGIAFGVADSARYLKIEGRELILTGHSEGYMIIWELFGDELSLLEVINLRSEFPVTSPYRLWNIRCIFPWKNELVVTASEDGDLCIIDVLQCRIIHRQRYNETAQRGINHIFIFKDYLLLCNCTVGRSDKNLWLYRIEEDQFVYLDSTNLISNPDLDQVFSFDVGFIAKEDRVCFFCSTGEGLLWIGEVRNNTLKTSCCKQVSPIGGAVIAIHPTGQLIASIAYDIQVHELMFVSAD